MIIFCKCFLLFMMYSILGWIMEVLYCFALDKKIVDRGFLIGPICPIYGVGALLMILILSPYKHNVVLLFIMSMVLFSILEYFTSFFMEKIFKARWWDYSSRKFNLNGRICAETMVPFGVLGIFSMLVINPFFVSLIDKLSIRLLVIIGIILLVLFLFDYVLSFIIVLSFKKTSNVVFKDSTEEISHKVKEILLRKSIFHRRLVKAFPNAVSTIEYLRKTERNISKRISNLLKKDRL